MNTPTTQLTVAARAAVAMGSSKAEAELTALALQSKSITAVTSHDGRAECHAAAMTAKAARVGIEKAGKAARDDATQFSKAVISEERRLVNIIEPEECRLVNLRDEWDAKIAREKAAQAEAERMALAAIMQRIANIKKFPLLLENSSSESVMDDIEKLESMDIDDSFKAYYGEAVEAKASTLQTMRDIYAAKVRAETEALRIKAEQDAQFKRMQAEREELSRLRAEKELRDAEEKKERDAEFARLQRIRDEIAATQLLLAAEKAAAEKREADRIAAEQKPAPTTVAEVVEAIAPEIMQRLPLSAACLAEAHPIADNGAMMKTGEICDRLGFIVNAEFLESLGFKPAAIDKAAKLYKVSQFPAICAAIVRHVEAVSVMKEAA